MMPGIGMMPVIVLVPVNVVMHVPIMMVVIVLMAAYCYDYTLLFRCRCFAIMPDLVKMHVLL